MNFIDNLLGLDDGIEWYQMALRAVITYLAVVLMIRIGSKRFLGKLTSFDIILAIILGSILSRGITGASPFFVSLLTALILVLVHSGLSSLALKHDFVSRILKGRRKALIKNGELEKDTMKSSKITKEDILTAAREEGIEKIEDIEEAYLERNGEISIIKK